MSDTPYESMPQSAWDDWNANWLANGADEDVSVFADGADADAVFDQVATACAVLQLRCHRRSTSSVATVPGRMLVIYHGLTDSEAWWLNIIVGQAKYHDIPVIVLYRDGRQPNVEAPWMRSAFHYSLGWIDFRAPGDIAYRVRVAQTEILSRYALAAAARRADWPRNLFEGLKARRLAAVLADLQGSEARDVATREMWMQRKLHLLADGQAAVAAAKSAARAVLRAGYPLPIPIFDIVPRHSAIVAWKHPVKDSSGAVTDSAGIGVIQLNPAEPMTRQRYSCAHELGHWVFRHTQLSPIARAARHVSPEAVYDPVELAADAFAAEVLMPEAEVRQRVNAGVSLAVMARTFYVSMEAMRTRVEYLGL